MKGTLRRAVAKKLAAAELGGLEAALLVVALRWYEQRCEASEEEEGLPAPSAASAPEEPAQHQPAAEVLVECMPSVATWWAASLKPNLATGEQPGHAEPLQAAQEEALALAPAAAASQDEVQRKPRVANGLPAAPLPPTSQERSGPFPPADVALLPPSPASLLLLLWLRRSSKNPFPWFRPPLRAVAAVDSPTAVPDAVPAATVVLESEAIASLLQVEFLPSAGATPQASVAMPQSPQCQGPTSAMAEHLPPAFAVTEAPPNVTVARPLLLGALLMELPSPHIDVSAAAVAEVTPAANVARPLPTELSLPVAGRAATAEAVPAADVTGPPAAAPLAEVAPAAVVVPPLLLERNGPISAELTASLPGPPAVAEAVPAASVADPPVAVPMAETPPLATEVPPYPLDTNGPRPAEVSSTTVVAEAASIADVAAPPPGAPAPTARHECAGSVRAGSPSSATAAAKGPPVSTEEVEAQLTLPPAAPVAAKSAWSFLPKAKATAAAIMRSPSPQKKKRLSFLARVGRMCSPSLKQAAPLVPVSRTGAASGSSVAHAAVSG